MYYVCVTDLMYHIIMRNIIIILFIYYDHMTGWEITRVRNKFSLIIYNLRKIMLYKILKIIIY